MESESAALRSLSSEMSAGRFQTDYLRVQKREIRCKTECHLQCMCVRVCVCEDGGG